jgi:glycosyltransferase involved in cell wall biosynthesis
LATDAEQRERREQGPRVALIPWGFAIEDFLEPNGLTLDAFCRGFRGSWMFGYVEALRAAGVETVLICFSTSVNRPSQRTHEPTGARVLLLPLPRMYRAFRRVAADPYGRTARQTFGPYRGLVGWPLLAPAKELAPYLSTPIRLLVRALRDERVSAVLCQEYEFPRFDVCVLTKRLHRRPVFGVFQGGDYRRWRLERVTRPATIRMCDGLVAGARSELDRIARLYRVPASKLAHIPNPVDVQLWRPSDRRAARGALGFSTEARIAVWHGRVQLPKKGLDVLLEAWSRLSREEPERDLRLLLVGDGADAPRVASAITESGLGNVVFVNRLLEDQRQLRMHLAAADVYVFPSRHEGFAVAPIEAMACGLPVVATDVSGMADIVGAGEAAAGLVVRREDPVALGDALRALLHDEHLSASLGARARIRAVEQFSLEAVGASLRAFLLGEPT